MTAKEALENGANESFRDAKGNTYLLQLKPGLSKSETEEFGTRLAVPLSDEIRDLLSFASGFRFLPWGDVSFQGNSPFDFPELLPKGLPLAGDGAGNFWMLDIWRDTGEWGPVWFISHDPPVAAIQAPNLAAFIEQILDLGRRDHKNQLDYVRKTATDRIWTYDPYLLDIETARKSSDRLMASFSKELPEVFRVADLRVLEVGSGFSWGRGGPRSKVARADSNLIFGVEYPAKISLLGRLFKR